MRKYLIEYSDETYMLFDADDAQHAIDQAYDATRDESEPATVIAIYRLNKVPVVLSSMLEKAAKN